MPGYTYIGKLKNSFICDGRLSAYDIRVYLCLKKWDTWDKPVTVDTMAKEIGMNRRKFGESIKVLARLKYITIERDTNWNCNKYQIHKKAHVTESNTDVINCNTDVINCNPDVTHCNLNDVTHCNPLSIPSNIPIKEKDKKEKPKAPAAGKTLEKDKDLITDIIIMWNEISGQSLQTTTKQYRVDITWGISQFNGLADEEVKTKFRFAFENKKRMLDDPAHPFETFELPTIMRRGKFMGNVDAQKYGKKLELEQPTSGARRIIK